MIMAHTIGLIGCGGIAGTWIEAVGRTLGCRIAMTYDVDSEAARKRAETAGAHPVAHLKEMLASPDIDIVIIGTPTFTHADLAVQAAQAGKHILCEKPMSLSLAGCQRMIDACEAGGVKLAVGHSLRFWGAFRKVRELVAGGAVGTPCIGQIHRMGPARIIPAVQAEKPGTGHWRMDTRYSGGNILEGFIHELDFSRTLFGDVASVYCEATGNRRYGDLMSPTVVQAVIDYATGAAATLRMGGIVGFPCNGAWIGGTKGTVAFDGWGGPVRRYQPEITEPEVIPCDDTPAYVLELQDLIQAVETGGEPENSGLNGKKNVGLCLAMYRSIERGTRFLFTDGLPDDIAPEEQYLGPSAIR
jgi:predicted dehydrogenase